jgi:methylated-DNA-[protein]-cysteine S-methyltransferase
MMLHRTSMTTPIGELTLIASERGLRAINLPLPERRPVAPAGESADHPILTAARTQLDEYFRGERQDFELPLDAEGTPFQKEVWAALRQIPYGVTESYGELATRVGRPGAARAVGGANGRNPLPIVVPCHRVIGASGALTGYAGPDESGLAMKRWLLDLEHTRAA